MATKKTKITRVPSDVIDDLQKAINVRFANKLVKKPDLTESFRLLKRTPEYNISLEKIKKFPKKEDLK